MATKSAPATVGVPASPPIFNPSQLDQVEFAEYRSNAIARDTEQRREEGREDHPQRGAMHGEAMAYAYMLMASGRWSVEQVVQFEKRLLGT